MVQSNVVTEMIIRSGASAVRLSRTAKHFFSSHSFYSPYFPPEAIILTNKQHFQLQVFPLSLWGNFYFLSGLVWERISWLFFKQLERLDQVSPSSWSLPEEWEDRWGRRAETLRSERTKEQKRRELLPKMEENTFPGATRKSSLTG